MQLRQANLQGLKQRLGEKKIALREEADFMRKNWIWGVLLLAVLLVCLQMFAQESTVRGSLSGVVFDASGAVVPGAKATLTGPTGNKTLTTENDGRFTFPLLTPGKYSVRVEKQGFKSVDASNLEVTVGRTASVTVTLQPGAASETVEVTGTATTVDTTSTAVGASLPDTFYQQVPVARNVSGLFYVAPGAADSGGAGRSNPSISGASGLENLYVADGVNITDSSFGGLGVFTRRQGSIGSGINLSFIKEVNVKTSSFEPQYGQADGGVVQLITKSGTNHYHGEIGAYAAPHGAEATYLQTDNVRVNKNGFFNGRANYDVDGEIGGPVPGMKDHLFFFGSFDPTWNQQFVGAALHPDGTPTGLRLLFPHGLTLFARVYNYAGKLTWKINDNHQIESSVFGDPTTTNTSEQNNVLNTPNDTAMSRWNYGTRNWVVRYNGTLSPTWLVNGSFTWGNNRFTENPKYDVLQLTDRTDPNNIHALEGFGFLENHNTDSYAINIDTQKIVHFWGTHTFSLGYRHERPNYTDFKTASGGRFDVPATNASGGSYVTCTPEQISQGNCPLGQTMYLWAASLRVAHASCTLCPLYNVNGVMEPVYASFSRGEFDPSNIPSFGRYHAAYFNDSWQMTSRVTLSLGYRWEQWHMQGTAVGGKYTFTDNWAPRFGITIDPMGDRKTKIFGNYARYNYQTPLDLAIRSLSAEKDILGLRFAPASVGGIATVNANGSLTLIPDAAHLLNLAVGGSGGAPSVGASTEGFAPGAKLQFQDEFAVGAEHEFRNGLVLSARFIYRTIPRVLEDVAGVSPESYVNAPGNTSLGFQNYFITNPGPHTDLFPNETEKSYIPDATGANAAAVGCTAAALAAGTAYNVDQIVDGNGGTVDPATGAPWNGGNGVCWLTKTINGQQYWGGETQANGAPLKDGLPDGFPTPRHIYKAVEIEANKSFAHYWMLRANYRIASLTGNYEGAFRNDNGQTDPSISSLFDFTNGIVGMLGDQYKVGPLNTDRRHIVNVYVSYVIPTTFLKNLEVGAGLNILSGTPVSKLADHPAYTNAGEVPLGVRGLEGRTPISGGLNLHADRPFKVTEKSSLHLTADFFNISNGRPVTLLDQNYQISGSPALNPDFLNPAVWDYQRPFYARFAVRWTF
jgi:Carboxypeptidase regulatory-like domain